MLRNFSNTKKKILIFFFEDARTFVKECKKKYDLSVVDLFFEDGAPEHLTTFEFYQNLNNCLNDKGIVVSNAIADFSNNLTMSTILSTFNSVFKSIYYFYDDIHIKRSNLMVSNLYILASNQSKFKQTNIKLENVPKSMKEKVYRTLKNINKFKKEEFNKEHILYDENNTYSGIFSKSLENYRETIANLVPSRILMN